MERPPKLSEETQDAGTTARSTQQLRILIPLKCVRNALEHVAGHWTKLSSDISKRAPLPHRHNRKGDSCRSSGVQGSSSNPTGHKHQAWTPRKMCPSAGDNAELSPAHDGVRLPLPTVLLTAGKGSDLYGGPTEAHLVSTWTLSLQPLWRSSGYRVTQSPS